MKLGHTTQGLSGLLIQEGLAVPYEGGTKGKDWCG